MLTLLARICTSRQSYWEFGKKGFFKASCLELRKKHVCGVFKQPSQQQKGVTPAVMTNIQLDDFCPPVRWNANLHRTNILSSKVVVPKMLRSNNINQNLESQTFKVLVLFHIPQVLGESLGFSKCLLWNPSYLLVIQEPQLIFWSPDHIHNGSRWLKKRVISHGTSCHHCHSKWWTLKTATIFGSEFSFFPLKKKKKKQPPPLPSFWVFFLIEESRKSWMEKETNPPKVI